MKIAVRKADRLWSEIIKARDGYRCRRCGRSHRGRGLQAAHIFTRARRSTRWELLNGVCLCTGCHMWAHRHPLEFHEWVKGVIGEEAYERLRLLSNLSRRVDIGMTVAMLTKLLEVVRNDKGHNAGDVRLEGDSEIL